MTELTDMTDIEERDSALSLEDKLELQRQSEEQLYRLLGELNISYEKKEHPAVYTSEEAERLCTDLPGLKMKNLLIKDKKTQVFYLIVLQDDRRLDFKGLKGLTGWKSPVFASEEELWQQLRLTPGSVTAFGLICDEQHSVRIVLDRSIGTEASDTPINFHPCVNTATISISLEDFFRFLAHCGNPVFQE